VSQSPFGAFTLAQYRNLAVLCLAAGGFFLAVGGSGFRGGVNIGVGGGLVAVSIANVAFHRIVRKRLHEPLEYWRQQQRRFGGWFWGAISAGAATGALVLLVALLVGANWLAGCAAGVTFFPALLLGGRLTGQVKPI
jgi:hypothetical protein